MEINTIYTHQSRVKSRIARMAMRGITEYGVNMWTKMEPSIPTKQPIICKSHNSYCEIFFLTVTVIIQLLSQLLC